jgi:hypothetical protein
VFVPLGSFSLALVSFGSFRACLSFCRIWVIVRARFGLLCPWLCSCAPFLCLWSGRAPFSLAFSRACVSSCSPAPAPFRPVLSLCRFLPFSLRVAAFSLLS